MSIKSAILGLLSHQPRTGYDLKKIIQEAPFMYWSGNNNQIYKALLELKNEGCVTNEVQHQESAPSKKIYQITEAGLAQLKNWILSDAEAPEFKKTFLVQLAWADLLEADELEDLLSRYENQIRTQLVLQQEYKRRKKYFPDRTAREEALWELIYENLVSAYETELTWVQKAQEKLAGKPGKGEKQNANQSD